MDLEQLQQQAAEYLEQGKYSESISLYEQCINFSPSSIDNYWYLGLALLLQEEELMAQAVWVSIMVEATADQVPVWTANLVNILALEASHQIQNHNWQLSETICQKILELEPNHSTSHLDLGIVYLNWGDFQQAISFFKIAIELNPDLAKAYYHLGMSLRMSGNVQQATAHLQKAIEIQPNLSEAYNNLAMCCMSEREIDQAISYLQKALELQPLSSDAYNNLGMCWLDKGKIDQAISCFEQAVEIEPSFIEAKLRIEEIIECEQAGYSPQIRQGYGVWDAWILKDDDIYRLFYLTGDRLANPFWSVGKIGAAISIDMKNWQYLGIIIEPDIANEWESGRMLAGSAYRSDGIYYLFYGGSPPKPHILNEGIGLATSIDGLNWQRRSKQFLKLDERFYGSASSEIISTLYAGVQHYPWRDPYIVKEADTNKYYMFITACVKESNSNFKGCIAVAVADRIDGEYEVLPPVAYPCIPGTDEGIFYEMERPQVIYRHGLYHLFFSSHPTAINPKWLEQVGKERITESSLYWYVSDRITGHFLPSGEKPIVKGSEKTNLYATNFTYDPHGNLIAYGSHSLTPTIEVSPRLRVRWDQEELEIIISEGGERREEGGEKS